METPGLVRYRQLLEELRAAREAAGGSLLLDEEVRRVAVIDRVWMALSEDEMVAFEDSCRLGWPGAMEQPGSSSGS